ncbi:MAG TPA: TIGR02453 family protein [Thermoplasmata archaeon]|nr:TIGR02453 family protein [Thermoplasmata archaeon]
MTKGDAPFGPELLSFMRALAKNNNRDWFNAHKVQYLADVQEPALAFIRAAGPKLRNLSKHLIADARPFGGSLSRIYRDTRFAKDKSPYKTMIGIHFFHDGGSGDGEHLPGLYLHLTPGGSFAASGMWRPEPTQLKQIRDRIVAEPSEWRAARKSGELGGESLQRVPPGFDRDHEFVDDLRRKDYIGSVDLSDAEVSGPGFTARFVRAGKQLDPLNRFLSKAIRLPW